MPPEPRHPTVTRSAPGATRPAGQRYTTREAQVVRVSRAESPGQAAPTIDAIMATESPSRVWDWSQWRMVDEMLLVSGAVHADQVPLLDSHNRESLQRIVGHVNPIRVEGEQLVGTLHLDDDELGRLARSKIDAGHLTDVSIGYEPTDWVDLEPDTEVEIEGRIIRTGSRPLRVTTRFVVRELSLTAVGADADAKLRRSAPVQRYRLLQDHPALGRAGSLVELSNRHAHPFVRDGILKREAGAAAPTAGTATVVNRSAPPLVTREAMGDDESERESEDLEEQEDGEETEREGDDLEEQEGDEETEREGDDLEEQEGEDLEEQEDDEETERSSRRGRRRSAASSRGQSRRAAPAAARRAVPARQASSRSAPTSRPADPARRAVEAERSRIREIRRLAGREIPRRLVERAIDDGWTTARASRRFLDELRSQRSAPAAHVRSHEGECTPKALAAAMLLRSGVSLDPLIDPKRLQRKLADNPGILTLDERAADSAHRYRDMSMLDVCREAIRMDGGRVPSRRGELIRAAVSGASLTKIWTTSVNAVLIEGFVETGDTTGPWCRVASANDFKQMDRLRLEKQGQGLKRLPRGKTAEHAKLSDLAESYRIFRYAEQFAIDEQDVIDDSLQALMEMPAEMGRAAARIKPDMVYAILIGNPKMRDNVALFHTSHNNLGTTGTVFGAETLQTAITNFRKQTENGVSLNLNPAYLLVPPDLSFSAQIVLASAERIISSASGGTFNPLKGIVEPITDNRIGTAGGVNPVDEKAYAGSATNYFLIASPSQAPTIEVAYLLGQQTPQLRPYVMDKGTWGIGWDIKLDIGAKALDWRGVYKCTGAS